MFSKGTCQKYDFPNIFHVLQDAEIEAFLSVDNPTSMIAKIQQNRPADPHAILQFNNFVKSL